MITGAAAALLLLLVALIITPGQQSTITPIEPVRAEPMPATEPEPVRPRERTPGELRAYADQLIAGYCLERNISLNECEAVIMARRYP